MNTKTFTFYAAYCGITRVYSKQNDMGLAVCPVNITRLKCLGRYENTCLLPTRFS
jgi:hypothetical protein